MKRAPPPLAGFAKGGKESVIDSGRADIYHLFMTQGLHRYFGTQHLHFITDRLLPARAPAGDGLPARPVSVLESEHEQWRGAATGSMPMEKQDP